MTYTEQLEREAELTRTHLSASLDELRYRLSPSQMVDQLVDYVQDSSGGEFLHNLKRQVTDNPLPVTLIGAGVAWLVLANGRSRNAPRGQAVSYPAPGHADAPTGNAFGRVADAVSETRHDLSARAHDVALDLGDAAAAARDRAGETYQATRDAAAGAYDRASDAFDHAREDVSDRASRASAAMADSIRSFGRGTAQTGQSLAEFCREQPLVVAGLGLAIGAMLGAALPSTETENRLMGDASEDAKRKMGEIAIETADKAAVVGEQALDAGRAAILNEMDRAQVQAEQGIGPSQTEVGPTEPGQTDRAQAEQDTSQDHHAASSDDAPIVAGDDSDDTTPPVTHETGETRNHAQSQRAG